MGEGLKPVSLVRNFTFNSDAVPNYKYMFDPLRGPLPTVLSTSFRKSFLLGTLHRRSKFVNVCHDLIKNHFRNYLCTKSVFF